jgi:hypothetical protein
MALDQDPLFAQPGQVKQLASAIDERVRMRMSVTSSKRHSIDACELPVITKPIDSIVTKLELTKTSSELSAPVHSEKPLVFCPSSVFKLSHVFLFFLGLSLLLGLATLLLDDPVQEVIDVLEGGADLELMHARLKILESKYSFFCCASNLI